MLVLFFLREKIIETNVWNFEEKSIVMSVCIRMSVVYGLA